MQPPTTPAQSKVKVMLNFHAALAFVSPSPGTAFGTATLSETYMSQASLPVTVTVQSALPDLFEKGQGSAGQDCRFC